MQYITFRQRISQYDNSWELLLTGVTDEVHRCYQRLSI